MKSKVRERKKENGKGGNRYSAKKERESWEGHAFYAHTVCFRKLRGNASGAYQTTRPAGPDYRAGRNMSSTLGLSGDPGSAGI